MEEQLNNSEENNSELNGQEVEPEALEMEAQESVTSVEAIQAEEVSAEDSSEEQAPQEVGQQDIHSLLPLLQALLISSHEPVDLSNLARACDSPESAIAAALEVLEGQLTEDQFGFCLAKVAKGYQIRTKPQYAKFIRILKEEAPRKLSSAALETLAVVAYRQPVVKHDIDGIRGVDVMPTLKTLIERGLVQAVGHKDTVGHPVLYGTTDEFLKIFSLNSLTDLPKVKELSVLETEPGELADSYNNPMQTDIVESPQLALQLAPQN